jgi:carboxylesterase 2/para-nitrobenzyl esterase
MSGEINVFRGIPFAAPPIGENRLRPPQPVEWQGVREAFTFGPKPPQSVYPPEVASLIPPELTESGDDCLTLNIWSSDLNSCQPVMVWIPGGMFEYHATGASPCYDGSRFARDGVVLVTINYRVGAEGFLYLEDGVANLGLLDQVAALEWIQANISAFGGDPDRVTIFGESAGALSVATLLSMPRAKGLFQSAIVESGGAQHVNTAATAKRIGRRLADKLGVEPTRAAIAELSIEKVIEAQNALRNDLMTAPDRDFWGEVTMTGMPWAPVIDGDVIPETPLDRVRDGAEADVKLLIGSNTEEWRLFVVPGGIIDHISPEILAMTTNALGLPAETGLATYREAYPDAGSGDLFAAVMTDWSWRIPAVRLADAHSANAKTFMYEFAWQSPQYGGRLGAGHALEIAFAFDTLGLGTEALLGATPPQSLADAMHGAWVAFAKTGEPGWPEYNVQQRHTMRFDTHSRMVGDPMARVRSIWEGIR